MIELVECDEVLDGVVVLGDVWDCDTIDTGLEDMRLFRDSLGDVFTADRRSYLVESRLALAARMSFRAEFEKLQRWLLGTLRRDIPGWSDLSDLTRPEVLESRRRLHTRGLCC